MITPVVGHITCDLDQQRRLAEARNQARARLAAARRRGVRRRGRFRAGDESAWAEDRGPGEDVWHALRF